MKTKLKRILWIGSLLAISTLEAFDDKKEGFMLSVGAGLAATHTEFKSSSNGWTNDSTSELGLATSFKIGYGFSEDFSLYLLRHSAFVHGYDNAPNNDTYGNCLTGIGANYYLDTEEPIYLMGAVGMGQLSRLSDDDSEAEKGKALVLGVGYELSPHLNLEATYLATRIDDNMEVNSDAFHVTLNYYWY